jgi:ElaA protein
MSARVKFNHKWFTDLTMRELYALMVLRDDVFVVGQKITAENELDGQDPQCVHIIGRLGVDEEGGGAGFDGKGRVVATARLFMAKDPVKVGRIAVAVDLQRKGVGTALMRYVHELLGGREGVMSAQQYLESWYAELGWQRVGDVYDEADIPHVRMVRPGSGVED